MKKRLTVHIPKGIADRVRGVVNSDPDLTISDVVARSVDALVHRLEQENGGPFPRRRGPLKKGRPCGKNRGEPLQIVTGYVDEDLLDRLRDAIYWTPRIRLFPSVADAMCEELQQINLEMMGVRHKSVDQTTDGKQDGVGERDH